MYKNLLSVGRDGLMAINVIVLQTPVMHNMHSCLSYHNKKGPRIRVHGLTQIKYTENCIKIMHK